MAEELRPRRVRRPPDGYWLAVDLLPAVLLFLDAAYFRRWWTHAGGLWWAMIAVQLLVTGPIAMRRLRPVACLAIVVFAGTAGSMTGMVSPTKTIYMLLLPLYTVASRVSGGRAVAALIAAVVPMLVWLQVKLYAPGFRMPGGLRIRILPHAAETVVFVVLPVFTVWLVGVAVRQQRLHATREQKYATRDALADERLRIAREMHDVISHSISMITVSAGIANHVADTDPDEARRVLVDIEATSRTALHDLRQVLGALRPDAEAAEVAAAALTPAPDLSRLDALVKRAHRAGMEVDLRITGQARPLPPGVELSAYRIVQEALTNVAKHAGSPVRAEVIVGYGPEEVSVEVLDDGPGRVPGVAASHGGKHGGGYGLLGMRERVGLHGGRLTAGRLAGGGFQVRASIPVLDGER
jgi:signal transduction histidine kinase